MPVPLRVALFVIALAVWMALNSIFVRLLVAPLSWFDPVVAGGLMHRQMHLWAVTVLALARWIARVSIRIEGWTPTGGTRCLIVANHQSLLDVVVLVAHFKDQRIKFAMKKELARGVPNVSLAARYGRFAILDRSAGGGAAIAPIENMCRAIAEEGASCAIFPEGTRSREGNLRAFKAAGTALLAARLDLPVVVVTIDGTWPCGRPGDMLRHLVGLDIRVRVEPPQPIDELRADPRAALAAIRALMERRLTEMRGEFPVAGAAGRLSEPGRTG